MSVSPLDFDSNQTEFQRLQTGPLIGRGTFGLVFKGKWNGQLVAIKQIVGESEQKSFTQEVAHLSRVNHENIIKCFGYSLQHVVLMVEYAECGSLHQLLHAPKNKSVAYNFAHAINWALQCARGVQYLHSLKPKPIVHRDLKPLNLLLKDQCRIIKICDFGTACAVHTNMTVAQGSVAWMAPEVFQGYSYTEKCDIFSWAITLWQIFSRELPYFNLDSPIQNGTFNTNNTSSSSSSTTTTTTTTGNRSQTSTSSQTNGQGGGGAASFRIMWAVHSGERPQLLRGCPAVLEKLLQDCWADQPNQRPSIDQVVKTIEPISHIVSRGFSVPIRLPPEDSYFDGDSSNQYQGIVSEPPISNQEKQEVDASITLPTNVALGNLDPNSATMSAHATVQRQYDQIQTLSHQNQEKAKQINSSNVYSVHSEIHVHPPTACSSTYATTTTTRKEVEEFIKRFEMANLDPKKLFQNKSLPAEIIDHIPEYGRRFQELVDMVSNIWTVGRFQDSHLRIRLQNKYSELMTYCNNIRKFIIAKEAREEGWEYVDQ